MTTTPSQPAARPTAANGPRLTEDEARIRLRKTVQEAARVEEKA